MTERTQINQTFQSNLPENFIVENPKFVDFLKQYYISQEFRGGPVDILTNLDVYKNTDSYLEENIESETTLTTNVGENDTSINVVSSEGWPSKYGILKINDEIITYTEKTETSFLGCTRGFSAITNLKDTLDPEKAVFNTSEPSTHESGTIVTNLSNLFLKDFFRKFKQQFAPGFENETLTTNLNDLNFYNRVTDFFKSKGTDESIKILFRALFGKEVEVIKPQDFLFKPSDSNYEVVEKLVCKRISGDPLNLKGFTLYQDKNPYDSEVLSASGSISDVDAVRYDVNLRNESIVSSDSYSSNSDLYYVISLSSGYDRDSFTSGTIEGKFKIPSKTISTVDSTTSSKVITVDSTVSFPSSGAFYLEDGDDTELITYQSKNINQFVDCSVPSRTFKKGSTVRSVTSVYGYENNDESKKVELIITGVLNDFESGSISSLSGTASSSELQLEGTITGTGVILGSDTILGSGVVSGTGSALDGLQITGKIIGTISKSLVDGIIYETGNPLLDGFKFKGSFNQSETFAKNLLVGDQIKVKSIGEVTDKNDPYFSSWTYNVSTRSNIEEILAIVGNTVKIKTFDRHQSYLNDIVEIIDISTNTVVLEGIIEEINTETSLTFNSTQSPNILSDSKNYAVRRKINFGKFTLDNDDHPNSNVEELVSGIQNTYDASSKVLVASESIPNYEIALTKGIKKFSPSNISNDVIFIKDHGFYSGDIVYYSSDENSPEIENLLEGYYYIVNKSINEIQLTPSIDGVLNGTIRQIGSGNPTDTENKYSLSPGNLANKNLTGQKLLKFIPKETKNPNNNQSTPIGSIGMFVNGVELINYKSPQQIHYGKIEKIDVLDSGSGYDVINPPEVSIVSTISSTGGSGAKANLSLVGKVEEIKIEDAGFDFLEEPIITLSGGGGFGCKLKARLLPITHKVEFDAGVTGYAGANSTITIINTTNNSFRIENKHKFRDADEVVYRTNGNTEIPISGISTTFGFTPSVSGVSTSLKNNSHYFVSRIDDKQFRLHFTEEDAVNKRHPINIVGFGTGPQEFVSTKPKNILSNIIVVSEGENYRNKKRIIEIDSNNPDSSNIDGVNTAENVINIQNHDYNDGDIITYSYEGNDLPISGLSTTNLYQVTVFDENNFRLSLAGVGTDISTKNYERAKYLKFDSVGDGTHIFNYPPIKVSVEGKTGIGYTFGGKPSLRPVVKGDITSVSVTNGGNKYGSSSSLINFDSSLIFEPKININTGEKAILEPIVTNGSISFVIVRNGGNNYTSEPDLKIIDPDGNGVGAILKPVLNNGSIESVTIVYGGIGYGKNTSIRVIPIGSGAILRAQIQKWNINLFERNKSNITPDDGIFVESKDSNLGIGFGSLYAPRKLRSNILTNNGTPDLIFDSISGEVDKSIFPEYSTEHSPIIGWSYDGNPIYGPYGYSNKNGGDVRLLSSGYGIKNNKDPQNQSVRKNGPAFADFPEGFFIEDYEYRGDGDLDEYNGRFCITPEFPNGIYAYFVTYKNSDKDGDNDKNAQSPFFNYKRPQFPYVIGPNYKSSAELVNFDPKINQRDVDLNLLNITRNTSPYKFMEKNSTYEYLIQPQNKNNLTNNLLKTSFGDITDIEIIDSGKNYKVGDRTVVKMDGTGSSISPIAEVESVIGVGIEKISSQKNIIEDVSVEFRPDGLIQVTSEFPHNFESGDIVSFFDSSSKIEELNGASKIGITNFKTSLSSSIGDVSQTGIATEISISSSVFNILDNLKVNDYLTIDNEKVKVTGFDGENNTLSILREQLSTTGSSHVSGSDVILDSRQIILSKDFRNKSNTRRSSEFYFNPSESVGAGIVGISTFNTVNSKKRQIKLQSIFIENHGLQTGDKVIYSSRGQSPIGVTVDTVGNEFALQDNSLLYAVNLGRNFVGLSTSSIGIGSDGSYVGVTTTKVPNVLYFTSYGSGKSHSLKTPETIFNSNIKKYTGIVTTTDDHQLSNGDIVNIDINSSVSETLYQVEYNSEIRKSIFNPTSPSNIDIENNIITIENHGYNNGDRIFYESSNPALPLENATIYYAHKITDDKFKLSLYEWDARFSLPVQEINLTTQGSNHRFSSVNPHIKLPAYANIAFDVSHSSLSNLRLSFFTDESFVGEFESTKTSSEIEIERVGTPGELNSLVRLHLNENFPSSFYYQLKPTNTDEIKSTGEEDKLKILPDLAPKPFNSNKIDLIFSRYNGKYEINVIDSKSFKVSLEQEPERLYYESSDLSKSEYSTESTNYFGPIKSLKIKQKSANLKKVPEVTSIASNTGSGAIINFIGEEVGNIKKLDISNIGFEFSSDKTLKPIADIPTVISISNYHEIESIKIVESGLDYTAPPNITIYDSELNQEMNNVIFDVNLIGSSVSEVNVINGGSGLSKSNLLAVSTNNTNGIDVIDAEFDTSTKVATLTLGTPPTGFTDSTYPFSIGQKAFVEGIEIISGSGDGYNSSNHGYQLFDIVGVNTAPGVANVATVSYTIPNTSSAGIRTDSSGSIIKESNLASYEIKFKEGVADLFSAGERLNFGSSEETFGFVVDNQGWDQTTSKLRVNGIEGGVIKVGDSINSNTTKAKGTVRSLETSSGKFIVDATSPILLGSSKETGKLSNFSQKIHDNNYYQRFSYSIKGTTDISKWDDSVGNLVHTSGFKRFSDYIAESSVENATRPISGITSVSSVTNLISSVEVDRIHDFDMVREDKIASGSKNISFNGKIITDFFRSDKNRAITIDDFSDEFKSNPNLDVFTVIDSFYGNTIRTCKYIIEMYNSTTNEYEVANFILTHNNFLVFIGDYTGAYNNNPFGSLTTDITLGKIEVKFMPYNIDDNIYMKVYRTAITDASSIDETVSLGFADRIGLTTSFDANPGVSQKILSLDATQYDSYGFIIQVETDTDNQLLPSGSSDYQCVEGFTTYDGGFNVHNLFFSDINTYRDLGIFDTSYSSGNLDLNFTLNTGIAATSFVGKLYVIGFKNTASVGSTFIDPNTENIKLESNFAEISASSNPGITTISTMRTDQFRSSKHLVQVISDSGEKDVSTIIGIHDDTDTFYNEYGNVNTNGPLGTYDYSLNNNKVDLLFTPNPGIGVTVKVFSEEFSKETAGYANTSFSHLDIFVDDFTYVERLKRYKLDFPLKHVGDSLFSKEISPSGISTTLGSITFLDENGTSDDHFFVTGEEIKYTGIGTERISVMTGTGYTDRLPETVFAIKKTENTIQIATSRSDALSGIALTITDFYTGMRDQTFDSINSNKKCVIMIDNIIQSPMTWTSITHTLSNNITGLSTSLPLTGISSMRDGDIVRLGNEFMRISSAKTPTVNSVLVDRSWMGTKAESHSSGDIVRIYRGDYNIVKDRIFFKEAPYGLTEVRNDFLNLSRLKTKSSFNGRFFQKSSYEENAIFDDISHEFNGIKKDFNLTEEGNAVSGYDETENSNSIVLLRNIAQKPTIDFNVENVVGIGTQLRFVGREDGLGNDIVSQIDVNKNMVPKGGIIVSVASSQGFGYQPQMRAVGIASVVNGEIDSVGIGTTYSTLLNGYTETSFPGSGYTQPIVPIKFFSSTGTGAEAHGVVNAGIVTEVVITNPGSGYDSNTPPSVLFDSPIPYNNLSLSGSTSGIGASVDVVVGQGSSIIDFKITNFGYGYEIGEILTPVGILEDSNSSTVPFTITVNDVYDEPFAAWNIGILELVLDISQQFDGVRRTFSLKRQGPLGIEPLSIEKGTYGSIDLAANLIVLLDGVIQEPNKDYTFEGGTEFTFTHAPKSDYECQIFFYKGSVGDTKFIDIDPPLEIGDKLQLSYPEDNRFIDREDLRTITSINNSNSVKTTTYSGNGLSESLRSAHLIKQNTDAFIGGELVSKKRLSLEALIRPESKLIRPISNSDNILYVDSISKNFNVDSRAINHIIITSQEFDSSNLSTKSEVITDVNVSGGHGIIVGVGTSSSGINTTSPMLEFTIQSDESINAGLEGIVSDIYFTVSGSNIGDGIISIENGSSVGIGLSFIDNIYKADRVLSDNGITTVYSNVSNLNGITSTTNSGDGYYYGSYSWGKITGTRSSDSYAFDINQIVGISANDLPSPIITRYLPFKEDF